MRAANARSSERCSLRLLCAAALVKKSFNVGQAYDGATTDLHVRYLTTTAEPGDCLGMHADQCGGGMYVNGQRLRMPSGEIGRGREGRGLQPGRLGWGHR